MKALTTYLNDHLAGSVAAIKLLDHLIDDHKGYRLEKFLVDLREEVHADQEMLQNLMRKLDLEESGVRKAGAWIAETIGQAKIALSSDGVGLLQAMEGLALGVAGKKLLWRALRTVEAELLQLQGIDLSRLEQRAADQFERVEKERLHVAREAFTNEEKT
jgi:hypothetical protein